MNFELSAEHLALRDRARAAAAAAQDRGGDIDRAGAVPEDLARQARMLGETDSFGQVIVVEELATASPALAIAAAGASGEALGLTGLRGATRLENEPRSHLVLAAAALGLGRGALADALAELRRPMPVSGVDVEKPHWVVADVATELDAARLLTYKAARTLNEADIAVARLMATAAAGRAVDTALRVCGAEALKEGTRLERLSRDVRALAVVLGTEEHQRAIAAEGLLPHQPTT